ncbi:MAG: hypothetical protein DME13_01895 [Candidatus Rokuibacteriota bacterium]|nr:MAG: hypothetical protein DME13_01895 [Candidatus Rokubacteria bacterium]
MADIVARATGTPVRDFARLVLARGEWQGRQVVPADWVAESLRPHIATGDGLGYGYQWWTGTVDWEGKKLAWSAGFGNEVSGCSSCPSSI